MGKNNSKRKEVTDFQRHESRMAKLEHRLKKEEEAPAEPTTKVCPFCQSEISIKATRCPNCTSELKD